MQNTTLCYMEKDGCYLMLYRNRKKNDENQGKWVGIGGHFQENESPEDCIRREIREETGLEAGTLRFRGIVTFVSDVYGTEFMHLFTASGVTGTMHACEEGELAWVPVDKVPSLPLWEGDRIFLRLLKERDTFFSLKLVYRGDALTEAVLDGDVDVRTADADAGDR